MPLAKGVRRPPSGLRAGHERRQPNVDAVLHGAGNVLPLRKVRAAEPLGQSVSA
jgi:hypothetical protein